MSVGNRFHVCVPRAWQFQVLVTLLGYRASAWDVVRPRHEERSLVRSRSRRSFSTIILEGQRIHPHLIDILVVLSDANKMLDQKLRRWSIAHESGRVTLVEPICDPTIHRNWVVDACVVLCGAVLYFIFCIWVAGLLVNFVEFNQSPPVCLCPLFHVNSCCGRHKVRLFHDFVSCYCVCQSCGTCFCLVNCCVSLPSGVIFLSERCPLVITSLHQILNRTRATRSHTLLRTR